MGDRLPTTILLWPSARRQSPDRACMRSLRSSICSTETVFLALSRGLERRGFGVAQAIWMGKTDGIYDDDGQTIPVVTPEDFDKVATAAREAEGADVTGGMRHRLESAIELGMIPRVEPSIVESISNGAGVGAAIFLSDEGFARAKHIAASVEQIDLDRSRDFERVFIDALTLE